MNTLISHFLAGTRTFGLASKQTMKWIKVLPFVISLSANAQEKPAKPDFYAFYNGMPTGISFDDEAKMLSEVEEIPASENKTSARSLH